MKVISIAFALILGFGFTSVAQEGAYTEAMQTNIKAMKDASGTQDYQAVANTFSRISKMNSSEWLPAYYTGFVYVIMSFQSGLTDDERDAYLDIAGKYADQAAGISENNSEIIALQGYVKMAELSVKPAIRGPFMSGTIMKLFGKAMELDPENPRAMLLMGRMKYGTAQFFKSGTEEACALINGSLKLFEKEHDRGILPHWGKPMAEQVSKSCNSSQE
ncbi:MAG TPA: hypothetical protein DCG19_01180 [Cryomorphaceae bacterium]|nr:hypothetical protein [Owenweeksia sp.]HAD95981.1 hypothetical protein [Cryomorphaceae bacterium]HBF20357.1 hypothetical protein [Cryomorphaceae bacterium]HCQ17379.1 hypothetical protein [Cryomorphaceae bacterium]|tara:strand:- start:16637 stop:17290 length:654 start_codon:yes stop_codon:yes gene_type:complete